MDSKIFFTIIEYYESLWKYFDIKKLEQLLDDKIEYNYFAKGDPTIDQICCKNKSDTLEIFKKKWFDIVNEENIKVNDFSMKYVNGNVVCMEYLIKQKDMVEFRAKEVIEMANRKIVKITLIRIKKN